MKRQSSIEEPEEPTAKRTKHSWDQIHNCYKERAHPNQHIPSPGDDPTLNVIDEELDNVTSTLTSNRNIRQKMMRGQSLDVLCLFAGLTYREGYLLSKLADRTGIKWGRLVVVDIQYTDDQSKHAIRCLTKTNLIQQIVFCESFEALSNYFIEDDGRNMKSAPSLDCILIFHPQYVVHGTIPQGVQEARHKQLRLKVQDTSKRVAALNDIFTYNELHPHGDSLEYIPIMASGNIHKPAPRPPTQQTPVIQIALDQTQIKMKINTFQEHYTAERLVLRRDEQALADMEKVYPGLRMRYDMEERYLRFGNTKARPDKAVKHMRRAKELLQQT